MGGVQAGYDTQFAPNWVAGLEANYSFLDTGSSFANPNNLTEKTGTIYRGRAAVPGQPPVFTRFR